MSDTPRTDAEVFEVDVVFVSYDGPAFEPKNVVEPDFARELERENAALRSLLREAVTDYELLGGTCDGVESEDYIARVKAALAKEDKP
jgi:hypothetical protein